MFSDNFSWYDPSQDYLVVGTGRSGTTVLVRTIARSIGGLYRGEIFIGVDDSSPAAFMKWAEDKWGEVNEDGLRHPHKITIRQTNQIELYPYLVAFFQSKKYQPIFIHRNPMDVLKSEMVLAETKQHQLPSRISPQQTPDEIDWPTHIVPSMDYAMYVARTHHQLLLLRSHFPASSRHDLHYSQLDSFFRHIGMIPNMIPLAQFYPEWDEAAAARMLLDALVETHDAVWASPTEGSR